MLPKEKTKAKSSFENINVCLVGNPKVGKTTLASKLVTNEKSKILFLATEKGHDFLDIYKVDIASFSDFDKAIQSLTKETHDFSTVVIDVFDRLYEFLEEEICKRNGVKIISDIPFGSGYSATRKIFINYIESLNKKNISVIFITHSKEKEYKGDNVSWTAMGTSLSRTVEETLLGMCDLILYCYMDRSGKRMIRSKPSKFVICAGDRSTKLPDTLEMDPVKLMSFFNPKE